MKSFVLFLIIGALSYLAGIWYPWWSIAVVAFVVMLVVRQRPAAAFFTAFLAVFACWYSQAFFMDLANDHILANRISEMFAQVQSPLLMEALAALTGGIVAGFAALTAAYLRTKKRIKQKTAYDRTFG